MSYDPLTLYFLASFEAQDAHWMTQITKDDIIHYKFLCRLNFEMEKKVVLMNVKYPLFTKHSSYAIIMY